MSYRTSRVAYSTTLWFVGRARTRILFSSSQSIASSSHTTSPAQHSRTTNNRAVALQDVFHPMYSMAVHVTPGSPSQSSRFPLSTRLTPVVCVLHNLRNLCAHTSSSSRATCKFAAVSRSNSVLEIIVLITAHDFVSLTAPCHFLIAVCDTPPWLSHLICQDGFSEHSLRCDVAQCFIYIILCLRVFRMYRPQHNAAFITNTPLRICRRPFSF